MRILSQLPSPRFGSVSVETVMQALETPTRFENHASSDETKIATLSGPFTKMDGFSQEIIRKVCGDIPGVRPDAPIDMYLLGFNYEDPRYRTDGASHGVVPVQDGQVHGLDLLG